MPPEHAWRWTGAPTPCPAPAGASKPVSVSCCRHARSQQPRDPPNVGVRSGAAPRLDSPQRSTSREAGRLRGRGRLSHAGEDSSILGRLPRAFSRSAVGVLRRLPKRPCCAVRRVHEIELRDIPAMRRVVSFAVARRAESAPRQTNDVRFRCRTHFTAFRSPPIFLRNTLLFCT